MQKSTFTVPVILALLCCSCAQMPREQLQLARQAMGEAYTAGAPELVPEEYRAAQAALRDAENLIHHRNYRLAGELLPLAASYGYRAAFLAREKRLQLETATAASEGSLSETPEGVRAASSGADSRPEKSVTIDASRKKNAAPPAPPNRYEVKKEESLWLIAGLKEVYGDALLWPIIYKANRDQIKDPRQVFPGQVLAIPRSATPEDKEEARREARQSDIFLSERPAPSPGT
ncbi:MAG: LysM peptidoglycan-binding domain-containing protein [Deltaproteobacteria bacterium]|nr:LysM peptidoglycan-binding domain-containing protein [Deltaproteobacteria bacterium]